tara:strand:+ start:1769 stop:2119 length:351 start_codon:yes stop_codon:yes gene_type:complete
MIPANVKINGVRSNYQFGNVDYDISIFLGTHETSEFDKYNKIFESYERSKGNIARAIFYIASVYEAELFCGDGGTYRYTRFSEQIQTLKEWNIQDPSDNNEIKRTWKISEIHGNIN